MEDKKSNNKVQPEEAQEQIQQVGFFELFRFATGKQKCMMIIGGIAAFINGGNMPLFSLIFGEMIDSFGPEYSAQKVVDNAWYQAKWFFVVGIGSYFLSWVQMQTWMVAGEQQAIVYRQKYFEAIVKQDISWFDRINPNQLATQVATQTFAVQGAIGEKVPTFIMTWSMLVLGFGIAFVRGWELALICTAALPLIAISTAFLTYEMQTSELKTASSYQTAGGQAEQAISGIKTVQSLNGQEHEQKNYVVHLKKAYKLALKYGVFIGLALGINWFMFLGDYGLGFWFGSIFVGDKTNNAIYDRAYTGGDVIVIFFSIMMGGFSLGQATPCFKSFALGKQAGFKIFQVIDAKPTISPSLGNGKQLKELKGDIELKDVEFTYPAKQDIKILKKINITIKSGQKTALVGESGSGKSTCMQLIERFYDADKGNVIIDGVNIKELDLQWYRDRVGYVGQEPALFATSIRENLKFGKEDATEEQMIQALKQANAWEFVSHLEKGLDTFVGASGSQLSGGQKQRLSIARAILKNPPILLLDEATSALDRKNEKEIQKTLDEISLNRTTIVIAHRLTTVQNSDEIIVMDRGSVIEVGNHQSLLAQEGKYAALCQNQIAQEQEEAQQQGEVPAESDKNEKSNNETGSLNNKEPRKDFDQLQIDIQSNRAMVEAQRKKNGNNDSEDEAVMQNLSQVEKEKIQKKKEEKENKRIMGRLYAYNKPEYPYMFLGGLFSAIGGCAFPFAALVQAKMMGVLAQVDFMDKDEFRDESDKWCLWFLIIALVTLVSTFLQFCFWNKVSQSLTMRLRENSFKKLLSMQVSWFDDPKNNAGALSARLGTDTQTVNSLTSTIINLQISNLASLFSGVIIGLAYDWRSTLVGLALFPVIMISGELQAQFMQGFSELTDGGYKDSGNLVQESVTNIRTVNSFANDRTILASFKNKLDGPAAVIGRKGLKAGIAFGFSQFAMFLVFAVQFYVGALFHKHNGVSSEDMFTAIFALMYAGFGAGNNNQLMTDVGAARNAARNIFKILDTKDEMQNHQEKVKGKQLINEGSIKGEIEFKNVSFKYPSREKLILNNISFKIHEGQKVAFVGPSGCGKSTIMQLLMRFYDQKSGEIYIDGKNIDEYDIRFLRKQFGVVSQEPILFTGTIEENIRYNSYDATDGDVKYAAEQSRAKDFIENDEFEAVKQKDENENVEQVQQGSGYKRQVGNKGGQLSGGQKQRVAIARAIIKKPKILLLDEATSALDSKNEAIVQESLDKIMQGKTTLAIAHRISTIKDSDNIIVIEEGNIMEQGNYQQLQDQKGYFYRLERGDIH